MLEGDTAMGLFGLYMGQYELLFDILSNCVPVSLWGLDRGRV